MRKDWYMVLLLGAVLGCVRRPAVPEPFGACPDKGQVEWQKQELALFFHFGPSTFSGLTGEKAANRYDAAELVALYRPEGLDVEQWVQVAGETGFKGVVLTAKHHDGFSLWNAPHSICHVGLCPAPYSQDVVKALSEACRKYGVSMGVYVSPWDKNDPSFGTETYNGHYTDALASLLDGTYGPVNEVWFDGNGANRSPYNFTLFNHTVRSFNPEAVIFSNVGPGCRWVGNELGIASETNWSTFSPEAHGAAQGALPGPYEAYLGQGDEGGSAWIPAEADLSIRPIDAPNGWFWDAGQEPKPARELMRAYYETVGRNARMLLNVPPTRQGVLDPRDVRVLAEFKAMRDEVFGTDLAQGARVKASSCLDRRRMGPRRLLDGDFDTYYASKTLLPRITLELAGEKTFNRVLLQEYIPLGQRVKAFRIQVLSDGNWQDWGEGTTVGYKRILQGPAVTATAVRITIADALAAPVLSTVSLHLDQVSGL